MSLLFSGAMLWMAACSVGPNYKRPAVKSRPHIVAAAHPNRQLREPTPSCVESSQPSSSPAAASLGDEKWWEVFQDKELQGLIRTALQNNYDVRIAAARVLEAQAQLGITRADQLPSLGVGRQRFQRTQSHRSVRSLVTKSLRERLRRPPPGTWISGAGTGARQKPRAPFFSPMNGRKRK